MTAEPLSHQDAERKNRAVWDEIAPVPLKAYKDVALREKTRQSCLKSPLPGFPGSLFPPA